MAHLMLVNVQDSTTDEEIREFLVKYGFPSFDAIERLPGDGSRPAVMLDFNAATIVELGNLTPRIEGVYWKGGTLQTRVLSDRRFSGG